MLYRIYTENKELDSVVKLTSNLFPAFNVTKCLGHFDGKVEQCLVIEIAEVGGGPEGTLENRVHTLAENIRAANGQDAVLVVSIPANGELVTRHDK